MKELLLILLCLPVIGFGQATIKDGEDVLKEKDGILDEDFCTYTGSYKDGRSHGEGEDICEYYHYIGEWKNGIQHGEGIEIMYIDLRANVSQHMKEKSRKLDEYLETVSIERYFPKFILINEINHGLWEEGEFIGEKIKE